MSDNIYMAINAIMQEVDYVQKERKGGLNYSFAGEAALIQALRPVMVANGVFVRCSRVMDIRLETYETSKGGSMNRVVGTYEFTFTHAPSDTHVTVEATGEGADVGDKAANKAMTGALKYALRQTFLIETGDDPDNTSSDGMGRASTNGRNAQAPAPTVERKPRPWSPDVIEGKFLAAIRLDDGEVCTEAQASYIASLMGEAFRESKTHAQDRYDVLSWLTKRDIESAKQLTKAEAKAILNWLTDEDGALTQDAAEELISCLKEAETYLAELEDKAAA